nr:MULTISPECIES: DUF4058 family protein [unclassified Moorena]
MLFWTDLGRSYKGLSVQNIKEGSIWEFIFPEIIGIKALPSKLFRAHVTPSANLVEIDLLRGWKTMPLLDKSIESDYRILVSREERRPRAELYTCDLPEQLPTFSLPLRPEDSEPIVYLQGIINSVYERGGYDYQLDYDQEPVPAFSENNRIWAKELLKTGI